MRLFPRLSSKTILIVLSVFIFTHLIFMVIYIQHHRAEQKEARHEALIQQVMNTVHIVQATPIQELDNAIGALQDSNILISFTDTPKWPLRFNDYSFWRINHSIRSITDEIKLSLELQDGRWLNIVGTLPLESNYTTYLFIPFEAFVAAALLFYAWSINRFTAPLIQFRKAAEELGIGSRAEPLVEYGPTVVRETAQAMNRMQKRIIDLLNDRNRMLGAISHDLRTPITRLKLRAHYIEDPAQQEKMITDLDEMESMLAETLAFSRGEAHTEEKTKMDLISLLSSLCADMSDLGYPVTFHCNVDRFIFNGRSVSLKRAFNNLINNAIKYGEKADINCNVERKNITITIDDEGPGIAAEELDAVFSPFYRCDRSRSRNIAGTGLGLAVAYDVVTALGGVITLSNRAEGGLRVTIKFK